VRFWSVSTGRPETWFQSDFGNPSLIAPWAFTANRPAPASYPPVGPDYWESEPVRIGMIARGGLAQNNDALQKYSKITFGSIADGSSNTAMLLEKSADSRRYAGLNSQCLPWQARGHVGGAFAPGHHTNGRFLLARFFADNDQSPGFRQDSNNLISAGGSNENTFGSAHPGALNAVFGDGSTHSLSLDTPFEVTHDLCSIADGYVVDHSDF